MNEKLEMIFHVYLSLDNEVYQNFVLIWLTFVVKIKTRPRINHISLNKLFSLEYSTSLIARMQILLALMSSIIH